MMKLIMPNMKRLNYLILMVCTLLLHATLSEAQHDSIRVEELLVLDTVALKIQGPSIDVTFYLNGIVFLSNTKYHQKMIPDHINFGEIASYFVPLEYIALESSRPLFSNDPFPYSPAGTSYSRDYQTVYFTKKVEVPGNRMPEKIFEANIINGEVTTYNQLPFTAGPTRFMHPAVSTDGEFMIMASDLTPSSGGLDLFISRKNASGWMTPVSLGSEINTSGHEWYPFLDQHNNLFFSSSGHMGYGGYDIYVCRFNGNGWEKPQNLSDFVNSEKNETGFSIHPGRKIAIFSSERNEENMTDEILKLGLNNTAFISAGIDTKNQDISLLLKDMISSGFTSATYGAASELEIEAGFSLTALPLLGIAEPEAKPEPEKVQEPIPEPEPSKVVPVITPAVKESEPTPVVTVNQALQEPEKAPVQVSNPNQVVFRVQIMSSSKAKSHPSVTISGSTYSTWEYKYKGAYRITVGKFNNLQDALSFRSKCNSSGYSQAFVAAFRGNERVTDPSVFK
ncbi:MAG: hypothetical protein R6W31_07615 [Bacteroidales bacterium]